LLFQCFLIAQPVSGDTPLIIRSLKIVLHPLVLHTFFVAGSAIAAAGNQKRT
jgi:hypothetical protein